MKFEIASVWDCYIILSLWTVTPILLAGSSNGKTVTRRACSQAFLAMVSFQEVCRLSTLVNNVWINVTAGKDLVDF